MHIFREVDLNKKQTIEMVSHQILHQLILLVEYYQFCFLLEIVYFSLRFFSNNGTTKIRFIKVRL